MTNLRCYDNQLTKLNVENNTALTELYAHSQQIEVSLLEGAVSFINPVYYKTSVGVETVRVGTEWYAYNATVPKGEEAIMEFTTNLPTKVLHGRAFGGTITFVSRSSEAEE